MARRVAFRSTDTNHAALPRPGESGKAARSRRCSSSWRSMSCKSGFDNPAEYAEWTSLPLAGPPSSRFASSGRHRVIRLEVNRSKPIAVPLAEAGAEKTSSVASMNDSRITGIPIFTRGTSCRYLGIRVGHSDVIEEVLTRCVGALRTRLFLATAKTHTCIQRAELARAIAIPKAVLATHAWPRPPIANKLSAAWIGELKPNSGALTEGSDARIWWPSCFDSASLQSLDGRPMPARLSGTSETPLRLQVGAQRCLSHLADSLTTCSAFAQLCGRPEAGFSRQLLRDRRHSQQAPHRSRRMLRSPSRRSDPRSALRNGRASNWPSGPTSGTKSRSPRYCGTWIRQETGISGRVPAAVLTRNAVVLEEVVRWTWEVRGVVRFTQLASLSRHAAPYRRAFEKLCSKLVLSYPELLGRPRDATSMRPYSRAAELHHDWRLQEPARMPMSDTTMQVANRLVDSTSAADIAASADLGRGRVFFHLSPQLARLVCVGVCSELQTGNGDSIAPSRSRSIKTDKRSRLD
ncbi:hypothetical protein PybrP1_005964 [[Pythium] brassicae (nom. inval.)]|nr:hypothetical protein PybrP1_005964 [[Pythium] brassicae (nom. inval.)]